MKSFTQAVAWAIAFAMAFAAAGATSAGAEEADTLETVTLPVIVVVADGVETPITEVGASVTVISREEIEKSQKETALEVLREVPGVDVTRSGGPGGQTSVFMRGANSEHTLVLIDGVEMNDPSNPSGAYDFATLTTDNIERIEILRGSQSIIYGSDAIGGVINIITREGTGRPTVSAVFEGGTFNTFKEQLGARGATERGSFSVNISRYDTDGISATDTRPDNETDANAVSAFSGKGRLRLSEDASFSVVARGQRSVARIDKAFGSFEYPGVFDDPNYLSDNRQVFLKSELSVTPFESKLRANASIEYSKHRRELVDSPDSIYGSAGGMSKFDGEKAKLSLRAVGELFDGNRVIAGVETERELMDQRAFSTISGAHARTTGFYAMDQASFADRVFLTAGVRVDDHEFFGSHTTYRFTGAVKANNRGTRIKGSVNSGFNAPSLSQLFTPFYGNEDLKAEESSGWEIGVEQDVADNRGSVGVTYFSQDIDNIFGFDPNTFVTVNIKKAESKGVEAFGELRSGKVTGRVDFTHTDTRDKSDGSALLRRAKNKLGAHVSFAADRRTNFGLRVAHIGSRPDMNFELFPAERVRLAPYTLISVTAQRRVTPQVTVFGRVENLLDEDYQEVLFFNTAGRSVSGGLRVTL